MLTTAADLEKQSLQLHGEEPHGVRLAPGQRYRLAGEDRANCGNGLGS